MSSNTFTLGTKSVNRLGYGAMQLAGPGVFGPPRDRHVAITVLREALALGVNHIDTSDFYGPHVTNQIIREALYPYSDDLTIVTKIGARRGEDASWLPAFSPAELQKAVHDNLRNLGLDVLTSLNATPMQVALAWLLQRSPNILLIPGTSSVGHLRENMASDELVLTDDVLATLDSIAQKAG
ncbi:aldo/keto reductase [Escherichia coli]|nr:aldo/keto reductase [Escherichia coli]MCI3566235.1 aldo/keto reductase [Escherichia coli]